MDNQIVKCSQNRILNSNEKKNELLIYTTTWKNRKTITLNERDKS